MELDADLDEALLSLAAEMKLQRDEVIQTIVREWLIGYGRLPFSALDEDSETVGKA